jgi:hypothetical protein
MGEPAPVKSNSEKWFMNKSILSIIGVSLLLNGSARLKLNQDTCW